MEVPLVADDLAQTMMTAQPSTQTANEGVLDATISTPTTSGAVHLTRQ
jgi:hypothetical protein